MTIEFTCQKCETGFELEAEDLIDGSEKIVCPHCDAKVPAALTDDFTSALSELRAQVAALGKKFGVSFAVESEEVEDVDEDEDEDEEEDDDEDELDFDEDEDEDSDDYEEDEP